MHKQKSVIVHGPQGCGKTSNALKIARSLGLAAVLDDWDGREATYRPHGTLHLTSDTSWPDRIDDDRRCLSFEDAMQRVRAEGAN